MPTSSLTTAVILAAGRGNRMWPYGETKPKAILPVLNTPNIVRQAHALRDLGFQRIIVVVGHLGGAVRHALRDDPNLVFVEQPEATGSADALRHAAAAIDADVFLVLYADVAIARRALQELLLRRSDFAGRHIALTTALGGERPQDWLCPQTAGGRITRIWGHPRGAVDLRLTGVFVLGRAVLPYLDAHPEFMGSVQVGTMPPRDRELAMTLQAMIEDGHELACLETREPCIDMDKPWHLLEAQRRFLDDEAGRSTQDVVPDSAFVHDHAEVRGTVVMGEGAFIGARVVLQGNAWIGPGSIVDNGAILGPNVMIGAGCEVRDYCKLEGYTVIGDGCHIGHAAEVAGLFFDNVWAVHYMELWGVVGSSSDVGAATVFGTLRFDDFETTQRIAGRREAAREYANACYLGDYTRTGVNAVLMPGCTVGPYSIVGPGVVLTEDVPARTLVTVEQTLRARRWGPERYGW